jgi:CRISPR-associated protein Csm2
MNPRHAYGRVPSTRAEGDDSLSAFTKRVQGARAMQEIQVNELIDAASRVGEQLARQVKATQLRHVLDETVRIRMEAQRAASDFQKEVRPRVVLLKPRLAYQAGRERSMKPFCDLLSAMIDRVQDERDFEGLAEFVQAVIAYHRYHGGSDH